jgi:hypothetical protein
MALRPTMADLNRTLADMFAAEMERIPEVRDIGLVCFRKLEQRRNSKRPVGQRGGSVIRPAPTSSVEQVAV